MNMLSLHILLVDDDATYCILLSKALTTHGHTVAVSHSGEDALDYLNKETFDLLIIDYKMGKISGIDVLKKMFEKKINIPVVLITGHGSEEIALEAWKWRAMEYLIKGESEVSQLPNLVIRAYNKWISDNSGNK